jgi:hypothetical protein
MNADLKQTLLAHLQHDPLLAPMLGQYDGRPSIFGFLPIPEAATYPAVTVVAPISSQQLPSKSPSLYEVVQDVEIWSENDQNPAACDGPADYIFESFERARLTVPGWTVLFVDASPPTEQDNDDFYSRLVSLRLQLHRGT